MVRMQIPPMDAWTSNVAQGSVVRITKSIVIEERNNIEEERLITPPVNMQEKYCDLV